MSRAPSSGNWRKPRMKVYDYNQEFGSNYYQPMIKYVHSKEILGPYQEREEIYMPDKCEVISDKYSNMRYADKSSVDLELEDFLVKAYKKQIKELNSSTATTHRLIAHNSKEDTFHTPQQLLGYHLECNNDRHFYTRELSAANQAEYARVRAEERKRERARLMKVYRDDYLRRVAAAESRDQEGLTDEEKELVKDVRAKMYYIYRPKTVEQYKQWLG